jgi:arylsulfatase A-like enzyme
VASLFTALVPYRHGIRYVNTLELSDKLDTLAERMAEAGYFTGAISDNLLITPRNGFDQGFRTFLSKPEHVAARKSAAVTTDAMAWLEAHGECPFFLYLHFMDPHSDYRPPTPYRPRLPEDGPDIRRFVRQGRGGKTADLRQHNRNFRLSGAEQAHLLDLYDGEIAANDFQLGRLLAFLRQRGLADRTAVIFLADHGEEFDDHGKYSHATSLYEEMVHVPLIIRLPAGEPVAGPRVEHALVRITDLAPTVLALAGAGGFDGAVDGAPLLGLLEGGERAGGPVAAYTELNPFSGHPMAPGWVEATRGLLLGDL